MDEFNNDDISVNESEAVENTQNVAEPQVEMNNETVDTDNAECAADENNEYNPDLSDSTNVDDTPVTPSEQPQYNPYRAYPVEQPVVPDFSFAEPRPQKSKNKGLSVFCIILALVLIVSLSVAGGYFAAIYSGASKQSVGTDESDLELAPRPENDSEIHETYSDVFKEVDKSVVSIMVYSPTKNIQAGGASGVIYSEDGYIVTNDHIYDGVPNAKFMVRLSDGTEYKASYVAGDTRSDLAVIKIDDKVSGLPVAEFGDSREVYVGEPVITVGYPSSYGDASTLTHGIISAVDRRVTSTTTSYASSFLQTDAVINPGNSGGALANMYGQVIGITSSKLAGDEYDAVSYAIPTVTMKKVVTSLIKDGCVANRAKLGITYTEINKLIAETENLPVGVYIGTISSDSGLANKGFNKGDVITHVNGKEITSSSVLLNVIENSKAGDTIQLTIYISNSKTSKTADVKLLADKGSSSYNANNSEESQEGLFDFDDFYGFDNNDDDSSKDENSSDDPKVFDFPLN